MKDLTLPTPALPPISDFQLIEAAVSAGLHDEIWFGEDTPPGYEDCMPKLRAFAKAILSTNHEDGGRAVAEFAEAVKELCRDFSGRDNAVYILDVEASIDRLLALHKAGRPVQDGLPSEGEIFDWLEKKYIQQQDERQKEIGVQLMTAETHELAESFSDFLCGRGAKVAPADVVALAGLQ